MGYPRHVALMCALLATPNLSCANNQASQPTPSTLPALKVCDSLLPDAAARKLEDLTGLKRFSEDGKEDTKAFSSKLRNLEETHEGWEEQELCRLISDIDESGREKRLIVSVSFWWSDIEVTKPHMETTRQVRSGKLTLYKLGARGEARDNGATIYFPCARESPPQSGKVLRAGLWTANTKLTGQAGRNARITILNAAARKIARQLGCLGTANLPEMFHKTTR
ncbi:hypothetical protein AB8O64_26450 [Streptomyces sp. QH1-20]|uniref:hypothetical protein n=1 Tax=Streptomyces sp. QH1-20 TaxID=3240934 RepID=UPI003519CDBE